MHVSAAKQAREGRSPVGLLRLGLQSVGLSSRAAFAVATLLHRSLAERYQFLPRPKSPTRSA